MRKSRFIEAQIIGMIKEQEAGLPTSERGNEYDNGRQHQTLDGDPRPSVPLSIKANNGGGGSHCRYLICEKSGEKPG